MRFELGNTKELKVSASASPTSLLPVIGRGRDGSNVLPTDVAMANAIDDEGVGPLTRAALREAETGQWRPTLPNIGVRSEAFVLRSSDDGDQTTALNAFLADANIVGKRRMVGYAQISDTLTVPAGTWFDGSGGVIEQTAAAKKMLTVTGDNVRLVNVSLTGNNASVAAVASEWGIYAYGASAASPLRNLHIEGGEISLVGQYAIDMKWVEGFAVQGVDISEIGYTGIGVLSGIDGWIEDNDIEDVLAGFSSNGYGIIMSRNPSSNLTADPRSSDITVRGNRVKNIPWNGIDTHAGQNLKVQGNRVYGCKFGIAIGSCPVSGVATYAPLAVDVIGNTVDSLVDDGSKDTGIIFTGATGASSSVAAVEYATGTIVGNTVRRHGDQSNNNQGGIMFRNTSALVVSANNIDQPAPHGICAYYDNRNTAITANVVSDPWSNTGGVGTSSAVSARADNNTGVVVGNALRNTGAKSGASFSNSRGISQLSGSGNDWTVGGNDFGAAATPISGTGATMRMPAGSAAAPGLAFAEDTDTGLYRIAANQMGLAVNGLGQLNFIDGGFITLKNNYSVSCANGFQLGGASSHKLGAYGATPVARPSAFTQTYSTASKTHAALTAAAAVGATPTKAEYDALLADVTNVKQVLNALIDDLQLEGWVG